MQNLNQGLMGYLDRITIADWYTIAEIYMALVKSA